MRRQWTFTPPERYQPLFVGCLFLVAGGVLASVAPHVPSHDAVRPGFLAHPDTGGVIFGVLGIYFLVFGASLVVSHALGPLVGRGRARNERAWSWWTRLIGGSLGALSFAVPSLLALPVLLIAAWLRPNPVFPDAGVEVGPTLWISALFTLLGAATLAVWAWVVRSSLRSRPRWTSRRARTPEK